MAGCAVDADCLEGFGEDVVRTDSFDVLFWVVGGGEEPGGGGAELVEVVEGFLVGLELFSEFWVDGDV